MYSTCMVEYLELKYETSFIRPWSYQLVADLYIETHTSTFVFSLVDTSARGMESKARWCNWREQTHGIFRASSLFAGGNSAAIWNGDWSRNTYPPWKLYLTEETLTRSYCHLKWSKDHIYGEWFFTGQGLNYQKFVMVKGTPSPLSLSMAIAWGELLSWNTCGRHMSIIMLYYKWCFYRNWLVNWTFDLENAFSAT